MSKGLIDFYMYMYIYSLVSYLISVFFFHLSLYIYTTSKSKNFYIKIWSFGSLLSGCSKKFYHDQSWFCQTIKNILGEEKREKVVRGFWVWR